MFKIKRHLALVLTLVYILALLPVSALAAETGTPGQEKENSEPDIKVEVIDVSKDITRPGADIEGDYVYVPQEAQSPEIEVIPGTPAEDTANGSDDQETTQPEVTPDSEPSTEENTEQKPEEKPQQNAKPSTDFSTFYDKDTGILNVTYRIKEDAEADELTLDLTQVMAVLNAYADETGNVIDYNKWEPGDAAKFCINIVTESGHTYRYKDGSFVLQSPDLGGPVEDAEEEKPDAQQAEGNDSSEEGQKDVIGFDGQKLPEQYQGESSFKVGIHAAPERDAEGKRDPGPIEVLYGKLFYNIDPSTKQASEKPDEDTFYLDNASFKSMYQMNASRNLSYAEYTKLNNYLNGKYETSTLEDGLKAYLVEWYSEKDQTEYADFDDMMKSSQTANNELYSGTQGTIKSYITVTTQTTIKNDAVYAGLVESRGGDSSTTAAKRFVELQKLINDKCGTSFNYTAVNSTNWNAVKNSLISLNCSDIANLMGSYSSTNIIPAFLKIYEARDGGSACNDYLVYRGFNPDDFDVLSTAVTGSYSSTALKNKKIPAIEMPLNPATRYDNFYKNLISFVYGDQATVDAVTGDPHRIDKTGVNSFVGEDGTKYGIYNYYDYYLCAQLGDEIWNVCDANGKTLYWYDDGRNLDQVAYLKDDDGNLIPLTPAGSTTTRTEYDNDSWNSDDLAATIGDYMDKNGAAWTDVNAFFKDLLGRGISAADSLEKANQMYNTLRARGIEPDDAAGVAFYMAFNIDGKLMGNDYQNTKWEWYNALQLERMDYPVTITKTDEKDNVITEECQFQLWYYGDGTSTESTGTKSYLVQKADADGNLLYHDEEKTKPVCVFVTEEEANQQGIKNLTLTIEGSATIDYAMMKDMIYFLQEKVAPEGYELDATIRVICEDEETYNEVKKNFSDGDKNKLMYAGSLTGADAASTGTKATDGTSGGYVLEIRVPNKSIKKTTPPRKTPQLRAAPAPMEEVEIIEDEVPLAYPETGDAITVWFFVCAASAAVLVLAMSMKKRREV